MARSRKQQQAIHANIDKNFSRVKKDRSLPTTDKGDPYLLRDLKNIKQNRKNAESGQGKVFGREEKTVKRLSPSEFAMVKIYNEGRTTCRRCGSELKNSVCYRCLNDEIVRCAKPLKNNVNYMTQGKK